MCPYNPPSSSQIWKFLPIESKNWADYKSRITPETFKVEILDRFVKVDRDHNFIWFITMNKENRDDIIDLCFKNQINIIPLDGQLSTEINLDNLLEPTIRSFIEIFQVYVEAFIENIKMNKIDPDKMKKKSTEAQIREYIKIGIPDKIIIDKFGIKSKGYFYKIKSKMKGKGEKIIDMRSKDADDLKKL